MTDSHPGSRDFPANGWYPEQQRIPGKVDLAAILLCVNGGLTLLMSFFLLAEGSQSFLGLVVALAVLAVAAVQIRAGVLVRQLVPWGRAAGIVLSALAVLLQILSMSGRLVPLGSALLLNGATIALLYHRDTLRVFPTRGLLRL